MPSSFRAWSTAVAALALSSCGGGGDHGASFSTSDWSGTYTFLTLGGREGVPASRLAQRMSFVADGSGGATRDLTFQTLLGVTSSPGTQPPVTYTVASDGAVELLNGATVLGEGGIVDDGSAVLLASLAAGTLPSISMAVRGGAGFSGSTMVGDWNVVEALVFSTFCLSTVGTMNVASTGASPSTTRLFSNNDGIISTGGVGLGAPGFTVATDGTFTAAPASIGAITGAIFDGGDAAIAVGDTATLGAASMVAFTRMGSGLSDSTFRGDYWVVRLVKFGSSFTTYVAILSACHADGSGSVQFTAERLNHEGTTDTDGAGAADAYSVASDGTLTMVITSGASHEPAPRGAVSPDGTFAFLGGGTVSDSDVGLSLFVRKH